MTLFTRASVLTSALIIALSLSMDSYAGKIYMWYVDGDPNPKYGEIPPKGVDAKLISDTKAPSRRAPKTEDTGPSAEELKNTRAQREANCNAEKQRLATLENRGAIRMQNPDGTIRQLSQEEILREIELSKTFLKDACGA